MNKHTHIELSEPYPFLDPGTYTARCIEATYAWSRQWNKWIARLVLVPLNYRGRPYVGRLCKFFGLGKDPARPYAGPQSHFRRLLVEVNGAQPTKREVEMNIFFGVRYLIEVATVTKDRNEKERPQEHWYSIVREMHPEGQTTHQHSNSLPASPSTQKNSSTPLTDQHSNTETYPLASSEFG